MGKGFSRDANISGDANVNIINELEQNNIHHETHEWKLWIILIIQILQILFTILKWFVNKAQNRAFKKGCKSMEILDKA